MMGATKGTDMTRVTAKPGTEAFRFLKVLKGEVGYKEGFSGGHYNNNQKYSDQVPGFDWSDFQPWCATFMAWGGWKNDIPVDRLPRSASCDALGAAFKRMGRWSEYPAIGAIALYGTPSDLNHTGAVYAFDETWIWTVEGNTNNTGSREGDGVYLKKRARRGTNVIGYGYPKFKEPIVSADPKWDKPKPEPKPEPVPDPDPTPPPEPGPKTPLVFWVDAHPIYQKGLDPAKVWKSGIRAICIKIGQGGDVEYGEDFTRMWRAFGNFRDENGDGFYMSVYYWPEEKVGLERQVKHLLQLLPSNDVPVNLDIEKYDPPGPLVDTPSMPTVRSFAYLCKSAGLRIELTYMPRWYHEGYMAGGLLPKFLGLWGSRYGINAPLAPRAAYRANRTKERWKGYAGVRMLHLQFGSRVRVGGKFMDCNVYRGRRRDLKNWFLAPFDIGPDPDPEPDPPEEPPKPEWEEFGEGFWNIGRGGAVAVAEALDDLAEMTDKFSVCEASDRDKDLGEARAAAEVTKAVGSFLSRHPDWQGYWSIGEGGKAVRTFWKTLEWEVEFKAAPIAVPRTEVTRDGKPGKGAGPGTIKTKRITTLVFTHRKTGRKVADLATHVIASWSKTEKALGTFEYKARRAHGSKHIAALVKLVKLYDPRVDVVMVKADLNATRGFSLLKTFVALVIGWTGKPTMGPREIDVMLHTKEFFLELLSVETPDLTPGDHRAVVKRFRMKKKG